MKSKLLVLGGSGLVGSTIVNYAKNNNIKNDERNIKNDSMIKT